jgi:hypothetical protein
MSMGWITEVAVMPDMPPIKKSLAFSMPWDRLKRENLTTDLLCHMRVD